MSVLENTRPGSFKGIPFNTKSSRVRRGVSRTNYLLANTSRRISKAMGGYAPDFSLTLFTHSVNGDNYESKRDALIEALDDDAPGALVHPFLGNFYVVAGVYETKENFSEVGICYFDVPFFVVDKDGENPLVEEGRKSNPALVSDLALAANRAMQDACADAFVGSTSLNKQANKSMVEGMVDDLKDTFAGIGDSIADVSEYTGKALAVAEKSAFYADNPQLLFAAMADGILGIDGLTANVFAKFVACQNLFDFDSDVGGPRINPSPTTREDAERTTSSGVSSNFLRSTSLFEAYSQSTGLELATVEDINETIELLDAQFEDMKDAMTEPQIEFGNATPDYSDTYEAMNQLRVSSLQFFEEARINAAKVQVINVKAQPASVLSYTLYGDSTRAQEIVDLNGLNDNMVLNGDILVLSK